MVYRLYVETVNAGDKIGWAFMFFNHQDFNVYKFCGNTVGESEQDVILETSARALAYFSNFMRRRYYDEHFATILDEDYITLFTELKSISECWSAKEYKKGFTGENKALWDALTPYFERPTMKFETAIDQKFIALAKDLASKGLEK